MARWNKTCNEFKAVREMIDNKDYGGIINSIFKICVKYAKCKWEFADYFDEFAYELEVAIDDNEYDSEDIDYYLDRFYDLCDSARVWLAL